MQPANQLALTCGCAGGKAAESAQGLQLLQGQAGALESLAQCMQRGWMAILVGPPGAGGGREELPAVSCAQAISMQLSCCMSQAVPQWSPHSCDWTWLVQIVHLAQLIGM